MSTDVARRRPDEMIRRYEARFAEVLPRGALSAHEFVASAISALKKDPKLMKAAEINPESLWQALSPAAQLGLTLNDGKYWLIPRNIKGKPTVTGMVGYLGYVDLMYRSGAVLSVKAEIVYEDDHFVYEPAMDKPVHVIDWFAETRGAVKGAYAFAILMGGVTSRVCMVGPMQIARAKASSAGSEDPSSPWRTDPGAMALKTAVRQLRKWVPTSSEYRKEALRAVQEVQAEAGQRPTTITSVERILDAEDDDGFVATDVPGVVIDADGVMHQVEDVPEDAE